MEINKTLYGIRHKESGLFYLEGDCLQDGFYNFCPSILLFSEDSSYYKLFNDFNASQHCFHVDKKFIKMFSKYEKRGEIYNTWVIPKEDLELVKFEYSLKEVK